MKLMPELHDYLEKLTGVASPFTSVSGNELRGVPAFLATGYRFHLWRFMGQGITFAESEHASADISAAELHQQAQQLASHLGRPIVFVFPSLGTYQRNRLVQLGVAFVVPGVQLFIPPFASLTERFLRPVTVGKLFAAAQVVVLYQLLRRPEEGSRLKQWADWLGYSAMTMSEARRDLIAAGLCEREPGAKARGLRFLAKGRALWDKARPVLRSPVNRVLWVQFDKLPEKFVPAGISALSKQSLLEEDAVQTYACRDLLCRFLVEEGKLRVVEHEDEGRARVERWRYDPTLLAKGGVVDPLSLYLSLADSADERVRLAADELLEQMAW